MYVLQSRAVLKTLENENGILVASVPSELELQVCYKEEHTHIAGAYALLAGFNEQDLGPMILR